MLKKSPFPPNFTLNGQMGVWMDSSVCYIIQFNEQDPLITTIQSGIEPRERFAGERKWFTRVGDVFIDFEKRKERRIDHQLHDYLMKVKEAVSGAKALFIFGPAQTKKKFKNLLESGNGNHPVKLYLQPASDMTIPQMIAKTKKFFLLQAEKNHQEQEQ